jgi:hypothetical protein
LSEHLSNWNMIDYSLANDKLIARNKCDKEELFC